MVFRQLLLFVLVFLVSFLSVSVADDDCLNYYDAVFKNMLEDTNTFGEFYEVAYDALLEAGAVDSAELNTFSDLNANPTTPIAEIPDNILHSLRAIVGGLCDVHPTRVLSDLSDVFPERYAEPYDLSGLYDALPSAEDRATFSLPLTADTGNCVTVDTNVGTHSRVMNCTGYLEESLVGTFIISYSFFSNVLSEFVDCPNDLVLSLTYTGNLNNRGWTCEEPLIYEPLETTHGDCEFTTSEYVHDIGFAEFERRVNCDGYNGDDLVGTHELIPITNFHAHLSSHISCVGDGEQSFAVVRGSRIGWVCSSDDISCEYGMYYDENLDECVLIDEPEDDVDDTADFYERDGTIYCYNAEIGDTGVVNGVTYTAYDNPGLYAVQTNASALETACTSHVTSFNPSNSISTGGLFYDSTNNFQPNISHWDTSKVTNMRGMFHTSQFNGDISNWNVSSVTNMGYMFYNAKSFNQPLYSWDVSSVIDMAWIFSSAHSFNQYIGDWDVSKVTNMGGMFRDASNFNQPIG
ncbi:MAG: BspA family leucine-rich repeat surface protein, partial [Candidatus Woesearchaeota archaeon]